jgi:hypothetical protein
MNFLRFESVQLHAVSGKLKGIFAVAYDLRGSVELLPYQHDNLEDLLAWFRKNLAIPKRFTSSKSKGYYRRQTVGLSWFKDSSAECLLKIRELEALLKDLDVVINCVVTTNPGYIVYEDKHQVVAEPFSDRK